MTTTHGNHGAIAPGGVWGRQEKPLGVTAILSINGAHYGPISDPFFAGSWVSQQSPDGLPIGRSGRSTPIASRPAFAADDNRRMHLGRS